MLYIATPLLYAYIGAFSINFNSTVGMNAVTNLECEASVQSSARSSELLDAGNGFGDKLDPRPRFWTVTYVCTVALQCFFILGFTGGFTSPVLSELSDKQDDYRSLQKKRDQDLFNVSGYSIDNTETPPLLYMHSYSKPSSSQLTYTIRHSKRFQSQ